MGFSILETSAGGVTYGATGDTITIKGAIDCAKPGEFLKPFLNEALNQTINGNMKEVKIDVRNLKFLNSSGISEFTDFILEMGKLPEEKRFLIIFLTNFKEYAWQASSIKMMSLLSKSVSLQNS